MSEHPTQFRFKRYTWFGGGIEWFVYDCHEDKNDDEHMATIYKTQAEAEAVCKLLNAAEGE
jgi:hypothetical protein